MSYYLVGPMATWFNKGVNINLGHSEATQQLPRNANARSKCVNNVQQSIAMSTAGRQADLRSEQRNNQQAADISLGTITP